MKKVCSKTADWIFVLMLIVPGSVLTAEDPPSAQDQAVREAQPVAATPVPPALRQALASSLSEATSIGAKAIPTPPTGSWGIVSEGDGGGGIFRDSDSEAEAWLGSDGYGVQGFGSVGGGYFKDSDSTGYAKVGWGNYGINAYGSTAGGYFSGSGNNGNAYVGHGNIGISAFGLDKGIDAYGAAMGGYFGDLDGTGYARVGYGDRGIEAYGSEMGGYFKDSTSSGYAYVGYGASGIEAYGYTTGGHFKNTAGSAYPSYAKVAHLDIGIDAFGKSIGGSFDSNQGRGIVAYGYTMGGYFENSAGSGYAHVADGHYGIRAFGSTAGGQFWASDGSGWADVGHGNYGIEAHGSAAGGYFWDTDTSDWALVANSSYKINGTGSMNFVQNHPYDPSSVIVYAAPEGDEVATYTRGTARLVEGEATVPLGETFKWVTNPDIGLTAHLTPVGDPCVLYVVEQATNEIMVRSRDGSDCAFDYMVYGLRIGFEESSIVQEKEQESYIPSMTDHRQLYERRPDLKSYNSLERFKGMHHAISPKARLDLSRAHALRDAIIEFDPAVHELPRPPGHERDAGRRISLQRKTQRGAAGRTNGSGQPELITTDGWHLIIPVSAPRSRWMTRATSMPRPSARHPRTWRAS